VSISAIPIVTAGDQYTLHCTATVDEYQIATPTLEWRLLKNAGDVVVGQQLTVGNKSTIRLIFNEIQTSQGGTYQYTATVNISGLDAQSQTANGTIYVKSELRKLIKLGMHVVCLIHFFSPTSRSFYL
jgi:hypothetical protein